MAREQDLSTRVLISREAVIHTDCVFGGGAGSRKVYVIHKYLKQSQAGKDDLTTHICVRQGVQLSWTIEPGVKQSEIHRATRPYLDQISSSNGQGSITPRQR
jgi:hypothetical protein